MYGLLTDYDLRRIFHWTGTLTFPTRAVITSSGRLSDRTIVESMESAPTLRDIYEQARLEGSTH